MKKSLVAFVLLGLAVTAHAQTTATWTKTTLHYTIYTSGTDAIMPFAPPSSVPVSGTSITNVAYTWTPYNNGNTSEVVELCYSQPYSSTIGDCTTITSSQNSSTPHYNGKSARGEFWIKHTISGGTYPATPSGLSDTVTVTYTN